MIPLVLGLIAAVIALWGVLTNRAIARRSATMQHLADFDSDRDLIAARKVFIALAAKDGGLSMWAEKKNETSEETASIRLVLNEFELIAVGIQLGIIDFEFYKRYNHGTVKKYWAKANPYIQLLRDRIGSQTVYAEFEQLHEWIAGDKKPTRNMWRYKYF